jgi:Ribonuclease HepT-like
VRDDRAYLGHIRDAIRDIRDYASVGEGVFLTDRMRQDAIIRKLEIIGEAVKQLSDETKASRRTFRGRRSRECATISRTGTSGWISDWCGVWSNGTSSRLMRR